MVKDVDEEVLAVLHSLKRLQKHYAFFGMNLKKVGNINKV